MAHVEIEHLTKRFKEVLAVDDLGLEIPDGDFVTLLGPSGCGKSTTLNCIAGLEEPTSGSIRFDGEPVNDLSPRDRDVAMVFQDYALYPHMSVYDNLAFALKLRGERGKDLDEQVQMTAQLLGIGELLARRPAQLSGGQRQRVALGRAIVRNPGVFLMDEPLSNLDAKLRVQTRTEIKRLQRELGVTTIYVTHDQEEAMVLSDRIAVLHDGRLQQYAPPEEVYNEPANRYVAGFIGSPAMNFLSGSVSREAGAVLFRTDGLEIELPAEVAPRVNGGREVVAGIRPSHVRVERGAAPTDRGVIGRDAYTAGREAQTAGRDARATDRGQFVSKVLLVEPVGPVTYADLAVGSTLVKASTDPLLRLRPNELVSVRFEQVYWFDPATGERL